MTSKSPSATDAVRTEKIPLIPGLFGVLGLLPFAAGAVLANVSETSDQGHLLVLGYGAVILSFLGGIQWGLGLRSPRVASPVYLVSNVISLVAWSALLVAPLTGLAILAGGFIAAFLFDMVFRPVLQTPGWFLSLRAFLTLGVLVAVGVSALPLL